MKTRRSRLPRARAASHTASRTHPYPCRHTAAGWVGSSKGSPQTVTPLKWKPYYEPRKWMRDWGGIGYTERLEDRRAAACNTGREARPRERLSSARMTWAPARERNSFWTGAHQGVGPRPICHSA